MKAYILTDLECVSGVITLPEYCLKGPENEFGLTNGGKYYDLARKLATMEVNAAICGLIEAGVEEILVCDAHGHSGIDFSLLVSPARLLTGSVQKQPRGLDSSFDFAIMIGQHAKANTDGGHLCHSFSFFREKTLLNGVHYGEIGFFANLCSYFNVPLVMITGDLAGCKEASSLIPSIETVPVIEGISRGSTKGMTFLQAMNLNVPAIHLSQEESHKRIKEGAIRAVQKRTSVEQFKIEGPYKLERINRITQEGQIAVAVNNSDNFIDLLNQPFKFENKKSGHF